MRTFYTEQSERILSLEYEDEVGVLRVTFKRGGVYEYYQVPSEVYDGLVIAQSLGKAFNESVKGIYNFKKIL